jgi:hypothetical protein
MTTKEIELLLLDLSYRLPHGVKFHYFSEFADGEDPEFDNTITVIDMANWEILDEDHKEWIRVRQIMPYLRPMFSMTEDEKKEEWELWDIVTKTRNDLHYLYTDFLASHHLDYRGLIEKGLALEAPEDMYKTI